MRTFENVILRLLTFKQISFREVVDATKENDEFENLLKQKKFFDELSSNNLLSKEDLKYLLDNVESYHELMHLHGGSYVFKHIVENDAASFKELIEKHDSIKDNYGNSCLKFLLYRFSEIDYLVENDLVSDEDCKLLLDKIDETNIYRFCSSTLLLEYCFKNFLIDSDIVSKFDKMLELIKEPNFFDCIRKEQRAEQNIYFLNLVSLYEQLITLNCTNQERRELFDLIQRSEKVKNNFKQLIENSLENQYSYEQLKELLTKDDNKKKQKLNF